MADRSTINATIDSYLAAFSAADRDAYLGCFAEGAWIEDPVGSPRREGLDAICTFWDEAHGMPDDCALSFDNLTTVPKSLLTSRVTSVPDAMLAELCDALRAAAGC